MSLGMSFGVSLGMGLAAEKHSILARFMQVFGKSSMGEQHE